MKYILKNKDIDVLEFEIDKNIKAFKGQEIVEQDIMNIGILNIDLLPINLPNKLDNEILKKWVRNRKIPAHRKYARKILDSIGIDDADLIGYLNVSLGLSLNDSFWIVPADKDYKWKDFNLYDNEFSEALKLVAFGEISKKLSGLTSSPEYTTSGMLPKCWHKDESGIYLYKGSSQEYANGGKEAFGEYYMAQIAGIMGFNHINYNLVEFHGKMVSACSIFTSENEGYVPIYYLLSQEELRSKKSNKGLEAIVKIYGREKFEDLMLFDAIIYNTDRHLGNFGMMINNDTNEILRSAPIFDNGSSIFNKPTKDDLKSLNLRMKEFYSYFEYAFDEQLRLFVQPRHIPNLQKLTEFEFIKHSEFNLGNEWLEPIQAYLQDRAKFALQIAYEKQNKEEQSKKDFAGFEFSNTSGMDKLRNEALVKEQSSINTQKPTKNDGNKPDIDEDKPSGPSGPRM